jgi:basic amino acid/polyamine antiporter, APA family
LTTDPTSSSTARTIGFFGALGIGVGAMVGGGILALAGVAFAVSGPSAILAFILNGAIAFITALSFAEMASANPQSGGTYTYAKKALSLQVAFGVGWIVWFASLVAAVLYALGFGAFAVFALQQILSPF